MLIASKSGVRLEIKLPKIGSRYTGKRQYHADSNGLYWESLPDMGIQCERIQKALLKNPPARLPIEVTMRFNLD